MIYIFFSICILLSIVSVFSMYNKYGKKYIRSTENLPRDFNVIIVLGAGVRKDGQPCDLLADRLLTAVKVYERNICKRVLLTGDHRDEDYNEVDIMKKWIIKNKVDEHDILLDGDGFCTYDSMYNAKNKFNIQSAIISTNKYHLPRAIYIARSMGIEAYGVSSDIREYDRMKKYKKRERLAQLKDFILVNLYKLRRIYTKQY